MSAQTNIFSDNITLVAFIASETSLAKTREIPIFQQMSIIH